MSYATTKYMGYAAAKRRKVRLVRPRDPIRASRAVVFALLISILLWAMIIAAIKLV